MQCGMINRRKEGVLCSCCGVVVVVVVYWIYISILLKPQIYWIQRRLKMSISKKVITIDDLKVQLKTVKLEDYVDLLMEPELGVRIWEDLAYLDETTLKSKDKPWKYYYYWARSKFTRANDENPLRWNQFKEQVKNRPDDSHYFFSAYMGWMQYHLMRTSIGMIIVVYSWV